MHTLGTAAKAAGVSKSSIYRALKSGRLSGSRTETGDYRIDPAELFRWRDAFVAAKRSETRLTQPATDLTQPETGALQAEIAGLKQIAELMRQQLGETRIDTRRQLDDLRADRDHWRQQAQRLALGGPKATEVPPTAKSTSVPTLIVQRASWWPWRRAG